MSTLAVLERLLQYGEAVMHERPVISPGDRPAVLRLLETAYAELVLETAGPPLAFDPDIGQAAAEYLLQSCWFLVTGNETASDIEKSLQFPPAPASAQAHLSADLCLRFLATVYRRVRIRPRDDVLHKSIVNVLRRWPLSGSAAEVAETPIGDLSFFDQHGLQLLYAERLAHTWRSSWVPTTGRTREAVELVLQQMGKGLPAPIEEGTTE